MVTPISLGIWPTPVERAPRLAAASGLRDLWIKRDDLIGLGGGGNEDSRAAGRQCRGRSGAAARGDAGAGAVSG